MIDELYRTYLSSVKRIKNNGMFICPTAPLHLIGSMKYFNVMAKADDNHDDPTFTKRTKRAVKELDPNTVYVSRGLSGRYQKYTFSKFKKLNIELRKTRKRKN